MKWLSRLTGTGKPASAPGGPARRGGDPFLGVPTEALTLRRTAFVPVTEPAAFGPGSGFGGQPWLADGVDHPLCDNCGEPKTLLAQLTIADLPEPSIVEGAGLLQVFYCTSESGSARRVLQMVDGGTPCDVELEGWAPFSEAHELRVVPGGPDGHASDAGTPYPPKRVHHWDAVDEIPNWEELGQLGVTVPDDVADRMGDADIPHSGEKLGGWPAWIQGVEYPTCRICGQTMRYILQIDSQHNLPILFGDVGTGHVSQCPDDPEELAFAWACS